MFLQNQRSDTLLFRECNSVARIALSLLCQVCQIPDISGGMAGGNTNYQQATVWGAIAKTSGSEYGNTANAGHTRPDWTFCASRSNNKYGQSPTIQPQAFYTLIIVKI